MDVLVDTNIYIDYLMKRHNWKAARAFFEDTVSCKHKIFIIEEILFELNTDYIDFDIISSELKRKNKLVMLNSEEFSNEAYHISKELNVPFTDAIIAIVAKNNGLVVLTRDKHFSQNLSFCADCFKPEDLL